MQIEALKEATRSKGNVWRREYHFRSDPRRFPTTPHLHCDFKAVDQAGESIGEKATYRRQRKMRRTQEEFLEAM